MKNFIRPDQPGGTTVTAAAVLGIALLVSVLGSIYTYVRAGEAYSRQTAVAQAQQHLEGLLRSQLDEETALRGYLASGQRLFLEPYYEAEPRFNIEFEELQGFAQKANLTDSFPILYDLQRDHNIWKVDVAQPLIVNPTAPGEMDRLRKGKQLVDRIRLDFSEITKLLNMRSVEAAGAVKNLLLRAATLTAALMLLFGAAAIIADVIRSRTQAALERERIVGDTLQRAFLSGWDVLPYLRVGTAYVSAARHAAVGGDLFDVHRVDDHRCLLVVADVSGKGLEAAVETAFVKYSLRSLVEDYDDPSLILKKFNTSFMKSVKDETSFVSLLVGVLDANAGTLRYASAGHGPAFIRRGTEVLQLPVTGPLVGLHRDDEFPSATQTLLPDDVVVLATDGFTEARDTAGMMIDDEGAMRIIAQAPLEPQKLANFVVTAVTRVSGGRIADDLALLVIALTPPSAARGLQTDPQASASAATARSGA